MTSVEQAIQIYGDLQKILIEKEHINTMPVIIEGIKFDFDAVHMRALQVWCIEAVESGEWTLEEINHTISVAKIPQPRSEEDWTYFEAPGIFADKFQHGFYTTAAELTMKVLMYQRELNK